MGSCQLLALGLTDRDICVQTLAPLVWPVGTGGGSWLVTWEWVVSLSLPFPAWVMTFSLHHSCPGHLREMGSQGEATGEGGISGQAGAACVGFLAAEPKDFSAALAGAV